MAKHNKRLGRHGLRVAYLSVVGILLSLYAIYVESMGESHPGYVALCDYEGMFSCSKVRVEKNHFLLARSSNLL